MEAALVFCAQIVGGLALFLLFAVVCSAWLAGCLFLMDNHSSAAAVLGFVIPPIGFVYAVVLIARERAAERREHLHRA